MKIPALSASHGSDKRVYLARKFIITTAKTNNKVAAFGTDLKRVVIISILFFIVFSLVLIYIAEDLEPELRYFSNFILTHFKRFYKEKTKTHEL